MLNGEYWWIKSFSPPHSEKITKAIFNAFRLPGRIRDSDMIISVEIKDAKEIQGRVWIIEEEKQ